MAAAPAFAQGPALTVEGTAFVLDLGDGRVLRGAELAGATLTVTLEGARAELRIDAIHDDPTNAAVLLHEMSVRPEGEAEFSAFCDPGPDGRRLGFPIQFPDGSWSLTCTSGVVGKCVRFGYMPWATGPGGEPLAPYHAACTHMMRADYCGDDRPMTRDGTLVNIWDRLGIQKRDDMPDLTFEAAFSPEGAVCIAHVRVPANGSLTDVVDACPRLASVPTGQACTEETARSMGDALLFLDSNPAGPD